MLKVDRDSKSFAPLETPTLADVSISERYDLQEFICNSPDAFFREIGQSLFLIGKEVAPSKNVQDRIDLLAVDKEGTSVIIELKRGNHKLHMMQAISYAGMIHQWGFEDFLQLLDDDQQEGLADFLEVDLEEINRRQKIILIAEAFDYALLIGAEWLSDQFGVDVTCCRIALAKDTENEQEYFVCSNVFPAPELAQEAAPRGRRGAVAGKVMWADWDAALAAVDNDAVVSYFKRELAANRESYLRRRSLRFRVNGKRRWYVDARTARAYVWQAGRFDGDLAFWQEGLTPENDVKPVKRGTCLSFRLTTEDDFRFFDRAATKSLQSKEFQDAPFEEEPEDEEADET